MKTAKVLHPLSLFAVLFSAGLATSWLLPNHYPPWLAFHANACAAGALLLIALRGLVLTRGSVRLTAGGLTLTVVATLPWLHYGIGLLPLFSDAALISVCLLGAAFSYIVALHWTRSDPLTPVNYVLTAMAMAAVISTGLATYQWLGMAQIGRAHV